MVEKKEKVKSPKKPVKNAACYEKALQIAREEHKKAMEETELWYEAAEKAHKELDEVTVTVKALVEETISNLLTIKAVTSNLTSMDITYNLNIITRRIQLKFNPETEE